MSDYNIPIIEPAIDYTKVPPINQKRTIAFINHFIVHTVTLLNKFALSCEEKLFNFENKLQTVEAALEILESRLNSIQGLENEKQKEVNANADDVSRQVLEEIQQPKEHDNTSESKTDEAKLQQSSDP